MNSIRRSSYASIILLSAQSFKSSDQMAAELAKMSTAALRASALETTSASDLTLSKEYTSKAELDQAESSTLHAHAMELEVESEREEALAKEHRASSEDYHAKAVSDEAEADTAMTEAAAEEAIFEEENEKAVGEAAEAAREHAETQSDAIATGMCEWIPFLDLVCDVIGGVAAVGFEANAAQLAAESVVDFAAAAAAKAEEEEAIAQMEALQAKAAEDEEVASGFMSKAEAEELEAAEEKAQSVKEEAEAEELLTRSKEENVLAEEEAGKAEEEAMESEEQAEKSTTHGLAALYHAIASGLFSFVSITFFAIRFLIAVIIPGGETLAGFVPLTLTMATGERVASMPQFARNTWMVLPKQQMSYFAMHCSVLGATMVGFCSKFQGLELLDVRSRGGIIIIFALVAAIIQGLLLHSVPHAIVRSRSAPEQHILSRIMSTVGILAHSMLYLVPLFIMEVTEIWLLAGKKIFSSPSLQAMNPILVGGTLVVSAALYIFAFHMWTGTDSGADAESESESNSNSDSSSDVNGADESLSLLRGNRDSASQVNDVESMYGGISSRSLREEEEDGNSALGSASQHSSDILSLPTATPITNDDITSGLMNDLDSTSTSSYSPSAITASVVQYDEKEGVIVEAQTSTSTGTSIISQYLTDLKLPFEVLAITCMFVQLRGSAPVLMKLGPQIVEGHPRLLLECGAILLLISVVMWFLVSSNKKPGHHVGVWTGRFSTINA